VTEPRIELVAGYGQCFGVTATFYPDDDGRPSMIDCYVVARAGGHLESQCREWFESQGANLWPCGRLGLHEGIHQEGGPDGVRLEWFSRPHLRLTTNN